MALEIQVQQDIPPTNWDETVCRLSGSIYQSAAWADYEKSRNGARPLYLLARDSAGEATAGTLAFVQQSKHPLISWMSRAFRLSAHPFVRQDRAGIEATNLIAQCEKLARRRNF